MRIQISEFLVFLNDIRFWEFLSTTAQICFELFLIALFLLQALFCVAAFVVIAFTLLVSKRVIRSENDESLYQRFGLSSGVKDYEPELHKMFHNWDPPAVFNNTLQKQSNPSPPKGRFLFIGLISVVTDTIFSAASGGRERGLTYNYPALRGARDNLHLKPVYDDSLTSTPKYSDRNTHQKYGCYQDLPMKTHQPLDKEYSKTKVPITFKFFSEY